jgi:hypothetical protein
VGGSGAISRQLGGLGSVADQMLEKAKKKNPKRKKTEMEKKENQANEGELLCSVGEHSLGSKQEAPMVVAGPWISRRQKLR